MIYIFITIVTLLTIAAQHPFTSSPYRLFLSSRDHFLEVPPRHDCSCRITVFSVYNDHYTLKVQEKEGTHTHARVKIGSSEQCLVSQVGKDSSASMEINSTLYNGYEIT